MIIVSNTSSISNLAAIGQLLLLRQVYGSVTIPQAVANEIAKVAEIYTQAAAVPTLPWIVVQLASDTTAVQRFQTKLDAGESEAIALALELDVELKLAQMFQHLQTQFPQIKTSRDNRFRVTDGTFDSQDLSPAEMQQMATLCEQQGWGFTYSNVQCHIKPPEQNKGAGLLKTLSVQKLQCRLEQTLTVGDSPNDESLFDPAVFPHSAGVGNALAYRAQMVHQPAYMTAAVEGLGFCE